MFARPTLPLWLLCVAFGLGFLLPHWSSEGAFFDGEMYATFARNLADGKGSAWVPYWGATFEEQWWEHPPGGFWLMSIPFRLFGDGMLVENVHSATMWVLTGLLIALIWKRLFRHDPVLARHAWLPFLLWIVNPRVTWVFAHPMLEVTSTPFAMAAVLCSLLAMDGARGRWGWIVLAGLSTVYAVLVKGPVGAYPLAAAPLYALVVLTRGRGPAFAFALVPTVAFVVSFVLLWQWPDARNNLQHYLDQQLVASLEGNRGGERGLGRLLRNLLDVHLPALGVMVVIAGGAALRWKRRAFVGTPVRIVVWTGALALAGSLPLAASPRQVMFYLTPAFGVFAIALGALVAPAAARSVDAMRPGGRVQRIALAVSTLLLIGVVGFGLSRIGTYGRQPAMREDVKRITAYLASSRAEGQAGRDGTVIGTCEHLSRTWPLHIAFNRWRGVVVHPGLDGPTWRVVGIDCEHEDADAWQRVPLGTNEFALEEHPAP